MAKDPPPEPPIPMLNRSADGMQAAGGKGGGGSGAKTCLKGAGILLLSRCVAIDGSVETDLRYLAAAVLFTYFLVSGMLGVTSGGVQT